MEKDIREFIVYVDTSYLTRMPNSEKPDWNKLVEHAKLCLGNLDLKPRLEIHISEIALGEYRGQMIDFLSAKIARTEDRIKTLKSEWQGNYIAKELDFPFPRDEDIFPSIDEIRSAGDRFIEMMLEGGIKKVDKQEHHTDVIWENYFNWDPPFDTPSISVRDDRNIRDNRRKHIPDAWILEAAIDAKNNGHKMLCLCGDGNLSDALEAHEHLVFKNTIDILDILFPPKNIKPIIKSDEDENNNGADDQTPLDSLLSKALNENMRNIYLRILGFVVPLNTPTHDTLIDKVAAIGFDRKLIEACAVTLSDESNPYIKDTGSHYIVGDEDVCTSAADRLIDEIVDMLGQE